MDGPTLYLTRHGQTIWQADNRFAGSSEVDLDEHGREQADLLADWAKGARLTELWCSDLRRARDTAAAVAGATGLTPRIDARLRELHFGRSEGRTIPEMRLDYPERVDAFEADPVAGYLPEGEDPREATERGLAALHEIMAGAGPEGRVLVVCHSTLLRLVLCQLMGIELGAYRRLFPFVRNCGLTQVALGPGGPALLEYNTPLDGSWW